MQLQSKIEIELDSLGIEGFNSEYEDLVQAVETDVYKEAEYRKLTFFTEFMHELDLIEDDIEKIRAEVSLKIEEIEEELEEQEEPSGMDKILDQHNYYSQSI